MSLKLTFEVVPCGATLVLENGFFPPDTWTDTANSPKLLIGDGNVDSTDSSKLVCNSNTQGGTTNMTLQGASWKSQVNDTGVASCDGCQNTPNPQTWTLTGRR